MRFSLNGNATLDTKEKNGQVCDTFPVNAGPNALQVDVVPGSGSQKLCQPSGSLAITASSRWYIPLGSSTTSTLNVSTGDAGACPSPDQTVFVW